MNHRVFLIFFFAIFCQESFSRERADTIFTHDSRVLIGQVKGPLMPLRNGILSIHLLDGNTKVFRLDEIERIIKSGDTFDRLVFRIGRTTYQALGRKYFDGNFKLYETRTKEIGHMQVLQTEKATIALFQENYRDNFNSIFDNSFKPSLELKKFHAKELVHLAERYHQFMEYDFNTYLKEDPRGIKLLIGTMVAILVIVSLQQI